MTAAEASGAGYLPKHFNGSAGAMTENGKHPRREYNKVASEVSDRGQASAGPVKVEDGHGATNHSAGRTREKGGDKKTRRVSAAREPDGGETEERSPPERSPAPNTSGRLGGERGKGNPHPAVRAHSA